MARVKFDPTKAARGFKKTVTKATNNKKLQKDLGTFLTERIKTAARRGRPLNNRGKFPRLKDSTIAARRRNRERKHPAFSPARSNLTITGQLIEAVQFRRESGGLFALFVDKTKRKKSGEPNNRQLSGYLEDKGFVIFTEKGLKRDKNILKRIKRLIEKSIRRKLKKS